MIIYSQVPSIKSRHWSHIMAGLELYGNHKSFTTTTRMKGTYGSVSIDAESGRAVKRTRLFEKDDILIGCNLNEAVFAASQRNIKNLIQIDDVRIDEKTTEIQIVMEKGICTLHDFTMFTTDKARYDFLPTIVSELSTGLYGMHKNRIAHCDFKPGNIVLTEGGSIKIIDFGSARFLNRNGDILCTYAFCAPEALEEDAVPSPMCDAYGLGAVLYFVIFKKYLFDAMKYDTPEKLLQLHKAGGVTIPSACPPGVDEYIFDIMQRLLDPNPSTRLSIEWVYQRHAFNKTNFKTNLVMEVDDEILQLWDERPITIESIFSLCKERHGLDAFALAVNIMDRYVHQTGEIPSRHDIQACVMLAENVVRPDTMRIFNKNVRESMMDMLKSLEFRIYSDTCDVFIERDFGDVDYQRLKDILKASYGPIQETLAMYIYKEL